MKIVFIILSFSFLPSAVGQIDTSKKSPRLDLVVCLDSILSRDQQFRQLLSYYAEHYGSTAPETTQLQKTVHRDDSINLSVVENIISKYGWLGADEIGLKGNSTLFLVIQHADLKTQEKYLPIMRQAVKQGRAEAHSLALLEDRVLIRKGEKQIYGSQIGVDYSTKPPTYYVKPLADPKNVDKRRKKMGIALTMTEYASRWGIKWDAHEYIKDLPKIIEKEKLVAK